MDRSGFRAFIGSIVVMIATIGMAYAAIPQAPEGAAPSRAPPQAPPQAGAPADARALMGEWLAQAHDGVFAIGRCGQGDDVRLCGTLIGMRYTGAPPRDVWGRPQCGIVMLLNFRPGEDGRWVGRILDPQTGRIYSARIHTDGPDILKLRGYILGMPFLGETQTWTRYHGSVGVNCTMP